MEEKRRTITLYRMRDHIEGVPVEKFEDVISKPKDLSRYDLKEKFEFETRLYLSKSKAKKPPWVDFLESGFGELKEIKENENFSAVLIVRVVYNKPRFFAFTFGAGRFLLKPNSYVPDFGLRTSLNAIYQAEDSTKEVDPARLKAIDSKTVSYNILYHYIQADRNATFDTFGFDVQSDILKGVMGSPTESKTWGTRVSGTDSLHLNPLISLEKIGELCKKVEKFHQSRYYEEIFGWLGNVKAIMDNGLISKLEFQLEMKLKNYKEGIGNLELAPPEIVNWDQIAHFKFSSIPGEEYYELELLPFLEALERKEKLSKLSIKQLRSYQRIEAVDVNNEKTLNWSVFSNLSMKFCQELARVRLSVIQIRNHD